MEEWLVKARLEFVSDNQNTVFRSVKSLPYLVVLDTPAVHLVFGVFRAVGQFYLAGEGDKSLELAAVFLGKQIVEYLLIAHCRRAAVTDEHCLCLASDFVAGMLHEVTEREPCFQGHVLRFGVEFPENQRNRFLFAIQLFRLFGDTFCGHCHCGVCCILFDVFKHRLVGRIVAEYVKDEFLIDSLLHRIIVVRHISLRCFLPEEGVCLVFRCCRESEITDMAHLLTLSLHICHESIHLIFITIGIRLYHRNLYVGFG